MRYAHGSCTRGGIRILAAVLTLPVRAGVPRVVLMGGRAAAVMVLPAREPCRGRVRLAVVASRRDVECAAGYRSRQQQRQQGAEYEHAKSAHVDSFLSGHRRDAPAAVRSLTRARQRSMLAAAVASMSPMLPDCSLIGYAGRFFHSKQWTTPQEGESIICRSQI
jgi:hypothetical protein